MEIDYSIVHLPLHIKTFRKNGSCRFCSKKFDAGFIVSTERGGYLVCSNCKDNIFRYAKGSTEKENLISRRYMYSGGAWESNRNKH